MPIYDPDGYGRCTPDRFLALVVRRVAADRCPLCGQNHVPRFHCFAPRAYRKDTAELDEEGLWEDTWSILEAMAREGARQVLQQALELEVAECIEAHAQKRDGNGSIPRAKHPDGDGADLDPTAPSG